MDNPRDDDDQGARGNLVCVWGGGCMPPTPHRIATDCNECQWV